jgi:hypothetical protein
MPPSIAPRTRARRSSFSDSRQSGYALGYNFAADKVIAGLTEFFNTAEIRDILDVCTIISKILAQKRTWTDFVVRVFHEENLACRINQDGIVHPFIDEEFEVVRSAALDALNEARFGEARGDFEAAFRHLRNGKAEGKAAIRSMFPAVETAAKVLFPGDMARLMPNEVGHLIEPRLRNLYAGNQPAIDAGVQLLAGFKAWIIASQLYRHGQEQEEPADPPLNFVISYLSAGANYLRWMIELAG